MLQLELQVLDKNGNVLETIYPVINNLAPQKAGWTQEVSLQSGLNRVSSFEVSRFNLNRQTAPHSYTTYESIAYMAAPILKRRISKFRLKNIEKKGEL